MGRDIFMLNIVLDLVYFRLGLLNGLFFIVLVIGNFYYEKSGI
jgi:hypothetical protein